MGLILFRIDLGKQVGGGHYSRCINIARDLSGLKTAFLIRKCGDIDNELLNHPNHHILPPEVAFLEEFEYVKKNFDQVSAYVIDITHPETLKNKALMPLYLQQMSIHAEKLVVIDGRDEGALLDVSGAYFCDILVTPYVGSQPLKGQFQHLYGERYFVLPQYKKSQNHREFNSMSDITERPFNVLLTFGQSDPYFLTEFVLHQLKIFLSYNKKIVARVIVGPLVSYGRCQKIRETLFSLGSKNHIIMAPRSLQESYEWADLAISATGLSKYEMAYFGLPALLISATKLDESLQRPFDRKGVAQHLGYYQKIENGCIVKALEGLVHDDHRRSNMSAKGRALIDGHGGARIAEAIMSVC